jgi:ketosteroid isomerase-like protein
MASANLDLVRSIYAGWERGDFSATEWADPEIEFVVVGGPELGSWRGLAGMAEGWRDWLSAWEELRAEPQEYREINGRRILVLTQFAGRGRTSGLGLGQMRVRNASLFDIDGNKVRRLVLYWDYERALTDLGLTPDTGT